MTLHRAKGLEFDTVILPGLAREPNRSASALLRWRRRPQGLLLAPTKAKGGDDDPIYAYLKYLAADEERAEQGRLLYVGCTRAKRRLHLTAALTTATRDNGVREWKLPPSGSALARLWDALGRSVLPPPPGTAPAAPLSAAPPLLVRLPAAWTPRLPEPGVPVAARVEAWRDTLPFDWARETARHVGTVAHRWFAQLAREGPGAWDAARIAAAGPRIRVELAGEGVDAAELDAAAAQVALAVRNVQDDARGRWLFAPNHGDSVSEWALAGVDGDAIAHVVLDRTFVADGVRWIVDFKTGMHEGADVDAFLDREVDRYRGQLERYARFVGALDPRPIRLGLYFPLLRGWREWAYT
jgi:ATP-dependent exoDNAse (exonuclease V) beta subunit